jgi:hypothetical protein
MSSLPTQPRARPQTRRPRSEATKAATRGAPALRVEHLQQQRQRGLKDGLQLPRLQARRLVLDGDAVAGNVGVRLLRDGSKTRRAALQQAHRLGEATAKEASIVSAPRKAPPPDSAKPTTLEARPAPASMRCVNAPSDTKPRSPSLVRLLPRMVTCAPAAA